LADAAVAFERANSLAPFVVGYTSDLVQIQLALAQKGDAKARARAIELANDLAAKDPNNPRSHITRAITMQATGDIDAAARSIERALQLDPGSTNEQLYVVAVQVFMAAGRPADAVTAGERGIAAFPSGQALTQLRSELDRALVAVGRITCVTTMWRANPASPQAVGARITFAVDATGCRQQESQIAVLPPTGGPSIYLSSGSWSASHVWDTSTFAPGTYRVLVYTRALGWTGQYQAFYQADYVVRAP
jgi:tetratricopeptide (TPR) repeat protein